MVRIKEAVPWAVQMVWADGGVAKDMVGKRRRSPIAMTNSEDIVDDSVVSVSVTAARHPGYRANNTGLGQPRIVIRIKNRPEWWKANISVIKCRLPVQGKSRCHRT